MEEFRQWLLDQGFNNWWDNKYEKKLTMSYTCYVNLEEFNIPIRVGYYNTSDDSDITEYHGDSFERAKKAISEIELNHINWT